MKIKLKKRVKKEISNILKRIKSIEITKSSREDSSLLISSLDDKAQVLHEILQMRVGRKHSKAISRITKQILKVKVKMRNSNDAYLLITALKDKAIAIKSVSLLK